MRRLNEGLTDDLFRVFLVYVASSNRPPHELLSPNLIDLEAAYTKEFAGMTTEPIDLSVLTATRETLIADVQSRLNGSAANFLRSLQKGEPDFKMIGLPEAENLPAIRWKILNLKKLGRNMPSKHKNSTRCCHSWRFLRSV